ncbi:MAG: hypothetical protein AAGJ87_05300 [Pseudomonadota bacterium]
MAHPGFIAPLVDKPGVQAAIEPTVKIGKNQHSPDENFRVCVCFGGVESLIAALTSDAA